MRHAISLAATLLLCILLFPSMAGARAALVHSGNTGCRDIALTYDVEFGPPTQALANVLEELDVTATWFFTGERVHAYPSLVRQVAGRHQVGNHTHNHPRMTDLGPEGMRGQIDLAEAAITAVAGRSPEPIFRPPYGLYNTALLDVAGEEGYSFVVMWTVDPRDWERPTAEQIRQRIVSAAHPGAIVLQHGFPPTGPEGTRLAVQDLRTRGYQFLTVTEILGIDRHLRNFGGDTYVVQPEDSPETIARCHNVALPRLRAYNEGPPTPGTLLTVPHPDEVIIRLNGERLTFPVYPRIIGNRMVSHIRLLEQLGATVHWDGTKVIITDAGHRVEVTPGEQMALVDGQPADMLAPAVVVEDRVLVPVRFLTELMGAQLHWNGDTWTVHITTAAPDPEN